MATFLGIEDAAQGGTVDTAVGTEAAGFPRSDVLDHTLANRWGSTNTEATSTRLQLALPSTRRVRSVVVAGHNLGEHDRLRFTADDDLALRSIVRTDGVDDSLTTSAAIPTSADQTVLMRLRLPPPGILVSAAAANILRTRNAAGDIRLRVGFRAGVSSSPYQVQALWYNFEAVMVGQVISPVVPDAAWIDLAFLYRDSDKRCEVYKDGVSVGSVTATVGWSDTGDERLHLSFNGSVAFSRVDWMDVRIVGRAMSTVEIAAYRAEPQTNERDVKASWGFREGSGATVADSVGTADLTMTGGTWGLVANPKPLWSTGVLDGRGQWRHRQGLVTSGTNYVTSAVIGTAVRSFTISGLVNLKSTDEIQAGVFVWYGPSAGDEEGGFALNSDGTTRAQSLRGGTFTSISSAAISDGITRRWRVIVDGRNDLMSFYLAVDGSSESLVDSLAIGAFATLANCKLGIGKASGPTGAISDVRLREGIYLEADDDLTSDTIVDLDSLALVRLNGSILDQVSQARVYTVTGSAVYRELSQTPARGLKAADPRINASTADPYARFAARLFAVAPADVEVTSIGLEIWTPDNADGKAKVALLLPQSAFVPGIGADPRTTSIKDEFRPLEFSRDGLAALPRGVDPDVMILSLLMTVAEGRELRDRLNRVPGALVTAIPESTAGQEEYARRSVVGHVTATVTYAAAEITHTRLEVQIRGIGPPPSVL